MAKFNELNNQAFLLAINESMPLLKKFSTG